MIELVQEIRECAGKQFFLPNGVGVLNEGFVVADGGNDRVCLFDTQGRTIKATGGGQGFGKYRFKEPVGVFISLDHEIYVADWHNHRVVIYDKELEYLGEFGHYGKVKTSESQSIAHSIVGFLRVLAYGGSYIPHHFSSNGENDGSRSYSLSLLLNGLIYWWHRNGSIVTALKMMVSSYDAIDKPNGVAFYRGKVVISQKNARCLSVYKKNSNLGAYIPVTHYFGPADGVEFGRLGNITYDTCGYLYVCDERNGIIWKLDADFELVDTVIGHDSGTGSFQPFSCCHINKDTLVVCGGLNFQIIDLPNKKVTYCSENIGELHGVSYNKKRGELYIVDRDSGVAYIYKVKM